jgi:hypothetical protein
VPIEADIFDVAKRIADLAVAGAGIAAAGWGLARWWSRPRFICGIPPLGNQHERSDLGNASVTKGFRHNPAYFAKPLKRRNLHNISARLRRQLIGSQSFRSVTVDAERRAEIPILLENRGARSATGLTANIVFLPGDDPGVHLIDAVSESMPFAVYGRDLGLLTASARQRAPDRKIVETYCHALRHAELGDGIWLHGDLSANTYQLVVATLQIDPGCDAFDVIYTVNSLDGFVRARAWIQACSLQAFS